MSTVDTAPGTGTAAFTRNAMIACAFASPLLTAAGLLLTPIDATAEGGALVNSFAAHLDSYPMLSWLGAISTVTAVPGIFAASLVARAGRPVLGLIGMLLAFTTALPLSGDSDDLIYAALKGGLDPAATAKLLDSFENNLPTAVLGFAFLAGLLGFVLLGVAALLGRTAPVWAAVAQIVAPFLIPVAWFAGLGNVAAAAGWIVMTAGMGGMSLGLLRLR